MDKKISITENEVAIQKILSGPLIFAGYEEYSFPFAESETNY